MAIEVEQKFLLSPEEKDRLLDGATFIKEQEIWDHYFDNGPYALTSTDRWLRRRDGSWQLKTPHNWPRTSTVRQYTELETEKEIREALQIPEEKDLEYDLHARGFEQFAMIKTIRQKYKKGKFGLDLDTANLTPDQPRRDFYQIAEIELMVESEVAKQAAIDDILKFAREHGLVVRHIRGKLVEYIRRYRPIHFKALIDAKVVVEEQVQ
ncbi:MAG: hypothetical protein A2V81_02660 [Candidatus Abawacabacteria bacterium RBG_16_42_10]|uniref:CYTH domain-containing protein n=1 Tax=Candidatus Abawacabacteria bacterium RBG_16_42_10 TaxID=1817814 RepID=A0A1F4XL37_9BACT|nr:MAG: hypothetical protein A2V81_02660 [Candidatus Abawacabacteria bacterium RBG_16_42_10]